MIKLNFRDDKYVTPPGALKELLSHPFVYGDVIELALFSEHRFAFFFWAKWTRERIHNGLLSPPSVVTLDWHQDLVWPSEREKLWLSELDLNSNENVALYSWANLGSLNDCQIMAAAYLNLIGNIYVHCRQGRNEMDWQDKTFIDKYGNSHLIKKFREFHELEEYLFTTSETSIYFDLDLDFFTIDNPYSGRGEEYTYLTDDTIKEMLSFPRPFIKWIYERLCGFTIATEPEHTGGLKESNRLLNLINNIFFDLPLFSNYPGQIRSCDWKHLSRQH